MESVGIFYGSTTGNTEKSAKLIQKEFGFDKADIFDVADVMASDIDKFSNVIFGSSTWGIGDMQDDFETFLSQIIEANLEGKKVAIFGLGDQYAYSDSFVDAIGQIYENLKDRGCDLLGKTKVDGYDYDETKAELDGQFVGLVLDEENQSDLTNKRIKDWVEELKEQFN